MRRLLFLVADTGGGHRAAATAVAREFATSRPGEFDVTILDPVADGSPAAFGGFAALYGPVTRHARWLWGGLYHATNNRAAVSGVLLGAMPPVRAAIERAIEQTDPACVVSFHPFFNHIGVRAVRRVQPRRPFITVITDLVDVHSFWACADVDAVVVPSPGGFERCRRAGIPADRCHDIGLAVDASFATEPEGGRAAVRRRLGLSGERFVVLVCGGADGSGSIARRAEVLARAGLDIEVAVVCGRNRRAELRLRGQRDHAGRPLHVHGFVDNMADWVRASDVVVTKAGPGTIAEALACGVPLLLVWYLPGQERGNVEWVVDIGAGRYVPRAQQLVDAVAELSAPGAPGLAAMRAAVRAAARPDATARIADLIVATAERSSG